MDGSVPSAQTREPCSSPSQPFIHVMDDRTDLEKEMHGHNQQKKRKKVKYRTYLFSLVQTVDSIAESVQLNPLFIQATQILDEER